MESESAVIAEMEAIDAESRYWLARTKDAALKHNSSEVLAERLQHEQAWWEVNKPKAPPLPGAETSPDAPLPDDSLPAGTDTTSGITPQGLNWFRLGNLQPPHDADTFKGDFVLPWGVTIANPHGIRALGFDACEVDRTRRSVVVTDAEIEQGKKARDALIALLANDGHGAFVMQAAPEGTGTRDNYGRPLAWIRLWHKDGIINLAEWAHENLYDRSAWLSSLGAP